MHNGNERLAQDVAVLEAMAGQMAAYLDSDQLSWPAPRGGMPAMTLGGYLLREHRLTSLSHLLSGEQQARLSAAIAQFNQALVDRVVRLEQKAQGELDVRLRQWDAHIRDIDHDAFGRTSNYDTVVEVRAIIQAVLDRLSMPPYHTDQRPTEQLALLDTRLRNRFRPGDFVWPADWATAYPQPAYWWLYGAPRTAHNQADS